MATKGEIRLAARLGTALAVNQRVTGAGFGFECLLVHAEGGDCYEVPITPAEYLQLRDKGEMQVIVNVRLIPKPERSR